MSLKAVGLIVRLAVVAPEIAPPLVILVDPFLHWYVRFDPEATVENVTEFPSHCLICRLRCNCRCSIDCQFHICGSNAWCTTSCHYYVVVVSRVQCRCRIERG